MWLGFFLRVGCFNTLLNPSFSPIALHTHKVPRICSSQAEYELFRLSSFIVNDTIIKKKWRIHLGSCEASHPCIWSVMWMSPNKKVFNDPNEKVCVLICLTLQSQMTRSVLTISFWVIYVWLCRDSTVLYLSGRAIYVWFWFSHRAMLCRESSNFQMHSDRFTLQSKVKYFH